MKHKPPQLKLLAVLFAVFALIVSACGDDASSEEANTSDSSSASEPAGADASDEAGDDTSQDANNDAAQRHGGASDNAMLRVGLQFGPDAGLAIETDDASVLVKAAVVEGLVRSDPDGQPEPALAESWERIDDNTWEFALRPGVVFHDGAALNADAVATALAYISGVASPPRSLGDLALTTEIVDDLTIRVATSDPDPILPLRLSGRSMGILSPAAYDVEPTAPIGTGPFAVSGFNPPDSLTVERFDDYWGDVAKLEGAEFRFIPDAGARAAAIRAAEVDVVDGVALPDLPAIEDDENIEPIRFSLPRTASLYANTSSGPLADVAVREAINLAIDRDALADGLLEGQFAAARSYFGPENTWAPQRDQAPADAVEQATALVEALDAADRSISIWTYGSRPELPDIATVVQAQLQAVGFEVELEVGEYTPLEERAFNGEHDLFLLSRGYYFDIADAGSVLTSDFSCEGSYNLSLYCSDAFDAIITELSGADSTEARQALFADAAQILLDDYVGFPLVHDRARYAARSNVEGLVIDPFESVLLTSTVSLG